MPVVQGETAVVVVVEAAETLVGRWRARYDTSAAAGVPPHVTVLYPFLPLADVIWLAPEPAEPFRRLTYAVWRACPHRPPYGGAHDEVTPHLTIADRADPAVFDTITADVDRALPCVTQVVEGHLLALFDDRWSAIEAFPLGPALTS